MYRMKRVALSLLLVVIMLATSIGIQGDIKIGDSVIRIGNSVHAVGSDYTFNGNPAHDTLQMQTALNALPLGGGRIEILTANVTFNANITRAINNVTIEGIGYGSYFALDGLNPVFTAGGNNWAFDNIRTDAGGISMGATTGWTWINVTVGATYYSYRSPYGQSVFNDATVATLTDSGLTNGRVPIAGVGGLLGDDSDLTFSGSSLQVGTANVTRTVAYTVAASDAPAYVKAQSDYVVDGTNDQVEINAAIVAAGDGLVSLSAGNFYMTDDTILLRDFKNGIIGQGAATIIHNNNAAGKDAIRVGDRALGILHTWYVTLENFQEVGNVASGDGLYIYAQNLYGSPIKGLILKSNGGSGLHIDNGFGGKFYADSFISNNYGVELGTPGNANQIAFVQSDFNSNAIGAYVSSKAQHAMFYVSWFEGNTNKGADVNSVDAVFDGNWFENNTNFDIQLNSTNAIVGRNDFWHGTHIGIQITAALAHNIIETNQFHGNGGGTGIAISAGSYYNIMRPQTWTNEAGTKITNNSTTVYNIYSDVDTATNWLDTQVKSVDYFSGVQAGSSTFVRSNEDLSAAIPITFFLSSQPDVPRTLSFHFDAHAQITAYTVEVNGINSRSETVTETFTDASGWDWETSEAYAKIAYVKMTTRTGTGVGDTADVGITDVLGLANKMRSTSDVYKITKNSTYQTVAVAQVNTTYSTYDMSVIGLAATDNFTIWYRTLINSLN